jgi:hypothetical protein
MPLQASPGDGIADISPSVVVSGSAGNTMIITYTNGATQWAASPDYGTLKITIPAGWDAPSKIGAANGYFTESLSGGTLNETAVNGQDIIIRVYDLPADGTITVTYGDTSGGGVGATAGSSGYVTFTVASDDDSSVGGEDPSPISSSPLVEVVEPSPTVTPTVTETDTATPTVTETITATITPTITGTGTGTDTITPTITPTITETESGTETETPVDTDTATPTVTESETTSETGTETPVETDTSTPTVTETETESETASETPSGTDTGTPTVTPTMTETTSETGTETPVETDTATPTVTGSETTSETGTETPVETDTATPTVTETETASETASETPSGTDTDTPTITPTITETETESETASETPSGTDTDTQTVTPTRTETDTVTPTITGTITPTITQTITPTYSLTLTLTPTLTNTDTPSATSSSSPSASPTGTGSGTITPTRTISPTWSVSPTWTNSPYGSPTVTQTLTISPTITATFTNSPTPTVTSTPPTGEGSAVISPSFVLMGTSGNTLVLDYTAGPTSWSSTGFGTLLVLIPPGWSAPSGNAADAGYFTVTVTSGTVTGNLILGQYLEIFVQGLNAGGIIRVIYGDRSGNGPGATAQPGTGTVEFTVSSQPNGASVYKIANSPLVNVNPATATVTSTITPTYTITPHTTPPQPSGLSSQQNGNNTTLSWNTAGSTDYYKVYRATGAAGKFNSFPSAWTVVATVLPTPSITSYTDNNNFDYVFYLITGRSASGEGDPGPMCEKVNFNFIFSPGSQNTYRISLPYVSKYIKASDIALAIEGSLTSQPAKADKLALWNPYNQAFTIFGYQAGIGTWIGTDWAVDAGTASSNAVYIHALSNFTWPSTGVAKSQGLYFKYIANKANANKRSIPYSANYHKASDVINDIEGGTGLGTNTKINRIALWDPTAQSYRPFEYSAGAGGWALGMDFTINPGDALNIYPSGNTSDFTWTPKLAMTPVP